MKVYENLDIKLHNTSVCIGKFDGLHKGHRLLINNVTENKDLEPVMFTFKHECNGDSEKFIYTEKEKIKLAEKLGIKHYISLPFSLIKNVSATDFIKDILCEKLDAKNVAVGEDFRFGKERMGDVNLLEKLSKEYGYKLNVFSKLKYKNIIISSTYIRELITDSKIEEAYELLGDKYHFMGEVIEGKKLGRTIGFPTVNVEVCECKLIPKLGAYESRVLIEGDERFYKGITNLGKKPTVGNFNVNLETYIIDFDRNIYGKKIQVFLEKFIRPEMKFSGVEELKKQLDLDIKTVM
ncbi:MAG: bifunctional riboflavin kinase/FAD synthetase [Lachnospiraceae bacterium]|nr:bifunctional riboflavin kinase/FAD synthetase [Lachnospiraceae bacterium]